MQKKSKCILQLCYVLILCLLVARAAVISKNVTLPCPLEHSCQNVTNATSFVCLYDELAGCIRKYASKCHMNIAACREQKHFTDYSNVYCTMLPYICEEEYERWTIFFGHEKD